MKLRANKILGLAVGQKSILLAEVATRSGRPHVTHCAEFVYPEGMSLATPDKLGEALAQFLRGRKFSTRDVVIGLPAKRLITRQKSVPPAAPAMAASVLRTEAESEFSSDFENLTVDYAGKTSSSATSTVLLIATARNVLDQCQEFAKAAGLKLLGITATTAALGRASSRLPGGDGLILNLSSSGAELVMQHGQDTTYLRHLNVVDSSAPDSIGALAGEIRRTVAALPRNGTPLTLALWNSATVSDPSAILQQRLSMPVTSPEIGKLVTTDNPETNEFATAVSVAMSAMDAAGLPVDFLNSRLAPPKDNTKQTQIIAGTLIAVIVIAAAASVGWQFYSLGNQLDSVRAKIRKQDPDRAIVQKAKDRLEEVYQWMPAIPTFVSCWRDLTHLFPDQGGTIWATELMNKGREGWTLAGKCTSETYAQVLRDQMLADKRFSNVHLVNVMEDRSRQITFELSFSYVAE